MSCARGSVRRVRSIMAPGNPVPGDAYADSWQDQLGAEGRERVLAQACEAAVRWPEAPGPGPGAEGMRDGRWAAGRGSLVPGRAHRVLAPAAAMVATAAIITGITLAGQHEHGRYEPGRHERMPLTTRRAALGPGLLRPRRRSSSALTGGRTTPRSASTARPPGASSPGWRRQRVWLSGLPRPPGIATPSWWPPFREGGWAPIPRAPALPGCTGSA